MCLRAASCRLWSLTWWWQLRDSLRGLWDAPQCELLQINLSNQQAHRRNVLSSNMAVRREVVKGQSQRHVLLYVTCFLCLSPWSCAEPSSLGAAPGGKMQGNKWVWLWPPPFICCGVKIQEKGFWHLSSPIFLVHAPVPFYCLRYLIIWLAVITFCSVEGLLP